VISGLANLSTLPARVVALGVFVQLDPGSSDAVVAMLTLAMRRRVARKRISGRRASTSLNMERSRTKHATPTAIGILVPVQIQPLWVVAKAILAPVDVRRRILLPQV
jgi:hypothetical protein